MSVESLLRAAPEEVLLAVERRIARDREKGNAYARCHSLALALAQSGREGLKDLDRSLGRSRDPLFPGSGTFDSLTNSQQISFLEHYALIWFGLVMKGIETAVGEQEIRPRELKNWYSEMTKGTLVPMLKFPEGEVIIVPPSKWKEMIEASKKDPSHASLFGEDSGALPYEIKELLKASDSLPTIRSRVIPAYTRLAAFLLKN